MREFILEHIKVDLTANTPNVAEYRENENVFSERVTVWLRQSGKNTATMIIDAKKH